MKLSTFIPFALIAFILILPTRPAVSGNAPAKMQLVINNPMKDKMEIERDFIVTEPYTISQGHLVFEATETKTNPVLKTVNPYGDYVMEAELIPGSSQKAPICFTARSSKDRAKLYGFYLYSTEQCIRLIETAPELKIKDLGKYGGAMRVGEPCRVKISAVGEHLAM